MRKKSLLIAILVSTIFAIIMLGSQVNAANYIQANEPEYDTTSSPNGPIFIANGTAITITNRTDGVEGAKITWATGSKDVPASTNVIGGGHEKDGTYQTSSIIMTGGTVRNVFGGGLHKSHVETTNVVINGGKVTGGIMGGGSASLSGTSCHKPWYAGDATKSPTRVDKANVTVNGGSAYLLYGGGEGISYTGVANLKVNGGKFDYVTAGGSNGYTGNANVTVTNGTIAVLQSVNRGTMQSADVAVKGGNVENLYVGGETGDSSVTGSIQSVKTTVTGTANVTNLDIGKSNGALITNTTTTEVKIDKGTVENVDENQFTNLTEYITVTIDGTKYQLEKNSTLSSLDLTNAKTKEGYAFVKFVIAGTEQEVKEDQVIEDNLQLTSIFEKNEVTNNETNTENNSDEKDETPKTSVENYVALASIVAVISAIGIVVTKKIRK